MNTDLLIVGGGPAGLNAAYKAASNGVKTTVIDNWFMLGGNLKNQTQFYHYLPYHLSSQRGFQLAEYLTDRLKKLDVTILESHMVIGAYQNGNVGVTDGSNTFPVNAKKIVIATGAEEEPEIFPGWTLPGVMTAGAAQLLMNRERVFPGGKVLVLGSNDFALEVVCQLNDCDIKVEGIIESGSELLYQDNGLAMKIQDAGIPVLLNSYIESATGKGEVEKVCVNTDGNENLYNVDLICVANGMTPILEPFEMLNCDLTYQTSLGGWIPKYDCTFQTTDPSVYIAGNAAGITSIGGIMLTGEIAAVSVMETLNAISLEHAKEEKQYLWDELYRIESAENRLRFDARLHVIQNLHQEMGTQLPSYLDSVFGGLING